ncbi:MAG: hypothetical protein AAF399_20935 [Bacteroidota bacterium]
MKSILTFFSILLFSILTFAQVPQAFNYQAVARDANGECLSDDSISLRISVLDDSVGTDPIYEEIFSNVPTNHQGLFSIEIGTGVTQGSSPEFSALVWNQNGQSRRLKVELSPQNNLNFIEVGMSRLLAVPYAQAAGNGVRHDSMTGGEFLPWHGPNGEQNGVLGGVGTNSDFGFMGLYDANGESRASLSVLGGGLGALELRGENGNLNVATSASGTGDHGSLELYDPLGSARIKSRSEDTWGGAGIVETFGENGTRNVQLSIQASGSPAGRSRGGVRIFDENDNQQIYLGIDANGDGVLLKDLVSFIIDHPHDPTKDIVYACIEGPEAAAYERGTAELINGEAEIRFSEHFEIVANPETMTVLTSPRSPDSKGLATFEYTATGFKVKELHNGTGTYRFDWEAKAVRKGFEEYEVIRDKLPEPDAGLDMEDR